MRVLIQRCSESILRIDNQVFSCIGRGLLVLVGIENEDTFEDINWLTAKIARMRIFDDAQGVMNLSVKDIKGEVMIVSQFTLQASMRKGNRPSYLKAANSDIAIPLYEQFIEKMQNELGTNVAVGRFGADMKISLTNDGPVTIWLDSKNKYCCPG